jgi:hypothetical protein
MNLYIFSSSNLTNIWAGIGARMWAVSIPQANNVSGAPQKAANMQIGSIGVLYCSSTQSFTTPFLVASKSDQNLTINDVWPEPWTLPFRILPLGSPKKQLPKDQVKALLPSLRTSTRQWNHLLLVTPATVFVPSEITAEDWEALMVHLADNAVP